MGDRVTYSRLGDYIREVNFRNRDLAVTRLVGLSMTKEFRTSTSNVIGTDMSAYKIVKPNQFACDFMSPIRVSKLPVVLSKEDNSVLVSPAYCVFEIIDREKLIPEYLMMWFRRSEFDRFVTFKCDSAIRGGYNWEELSDTMLPIPAIEVQREIVSEYETLSRRIALNESLCDKLEQTAQALYRKMFVDNIDSENLPAGWRMATIGEFGRVITGKTPSSDCSEDFGDTMQFVTPGDFIDGNRFILRTIRHLSNIGLTKLKNKIVRTRDIMVTCIGSDMGKVKMANEDCISNQQINSIRVKNPVYSDYLYIALTNMSLQLKSMALGSSTMPMLNKTDFENIELLMPPIDTLKEFSNLSCSVSEYINIKTEESIKLTCIKELLLSKLATN